MAIETVTTSDANRSDSSVPDHSASHGNATLLSARGADQLSLRSLISTSPAAACQSARNPTEPGSSVANCKPRAEGTILSRRSLMNKIVAVSAAVAVPTGALALSPPDDFHVVTDEKGRSWFKADEDPVFAAIERHRAAQTAADAATAEIKRLHDLADEIVGPMSIDIPSLTEPGTTVEASGYSDIEQAVPREQFPEQFAHYLAVLKERQKARFAVTGDTNPIGDEKYAAAWDAVVDFANTVPTTLPGLLAMITHAAEIRDADKDAFTDYNCMLIENLATAATALIGGSPKDILLQFPEKYPDGEAIQAGNKFEALLAKYLDAKFKWAPLAREARLQMNAKFPNELKYGNAGTHPKWGFHAELLVKNGARVAQAEISRLFELMEPLAEEIVTARTETVEGLRAKVLVSTWEALPEGAFHDGTWNFEDMSYMALWEAAAAKTGLSEMIEQISERLNADRCSDPVFAET